MGIEVLLIPSFLLCSTLNQHLTNVTEPLLYSRSFEEALWVPSALIISPAIMELSRRSST